MKFYFQYRTDFPLLNPLPSAFAQAFCHAKFDGEFGHGFGGFYQADYMKGLFG
ncbi:MAG: hypothetical protein GDA45_05230 [Chromatiales bacterium]|nr:hypothetical protein [Chromatiales bacterium]